MRIYLDSNIFIYLVEGYVSRADDLQVLADEMDAQRHTFVTSNLSLAEVLVRPYQNADRHAEPINIYTALLTEPRAKFELVELTTHHMIHSAKLRAEFGGSLADNIHVTTAIDSQCDLFVSEDMRPNAVAPLVKVNMPELVARLAEHPESP